MDSQSKFLSFTCQWVSWGPFDRSSLHWSQIQWPRDDTVESRIAYITPLQLLWLAPQIRLCRGGGATSPLQCPVEHVSGNCLERVDWTMVCIIRGITYWITLTNASFVKYFEILLWNTIPTCIPFLILYSGLNYAMILTMSICLPG